HERALPSATIQSRGFTPAAFTRTRTCPRPGSGRGACATFTPVGSPYEWIRAASMVAVGCGSERALGVATSANLLNGVPVRATAPQRPSDTAVRLLIRAIR